MDKAMNRYRNCVAATIFCAGVTGVGDALLAIGIATLHLSTFLVGATVSIVFFLGCCWYFNMAEEELDNVLQ